MSKISPTINQGQDPSVIDDDDIPMTFPQRVRRKNVVLAFFRGLVTIMNC